MQRLLLLGLLVPLWAMVALVAAAQVWEQARFNAAAQDAALRMALAHWPAALPGDANASTALGDAGRSADTEPPGIWYRESSLDGERLAGSAALPRVTSRSSRSLTALPMYFTAKRATAM